MARDCMNWDEREALKQKLGGIDAFKALLALEADALEDRLVG